MALGGAKGTPLGLFPYGQWGIYADLDAIALPPGADACLMLEERI